MAVGDIKAGYIGFADLGTAGNVRLTSANVAPKQEVLIPDLMMGGHDRHAWAWGPAEVGGSIAGPVTENFGDIWTWATTRDVCGQLTAEQVNLYYSCADGFAFPNMVVNSLNFSVSAGDIAQFTLDLLGAGVPTAASGGGGGYTVDEKLITWDNVSVTGNVPGDFIQSFEFTIANNVETVYAINSTANLFPFDIVAGLRNVTGSFSVYNLGTGQGKDSWDAIQDQANITFTIGLNSYSINAVLHRPEPSGATGPFVSTIGFSGVGTQSF